MNTVAWIVVNQRGVVRLLKTRPKSVGRSEVAVTVHLNIPDAFFETPKVEVTVTVPEDERPENVAAVIVRAIDEAMIQGHAVDVRIVTPEKEGPSD